MKLILLALLCLLPIPLLAEPPEAPPVAAPWSVVGTWEGKHPAWSAEVKISPDGTFTCGTGDAGRWSLTGMQDHFVLLLAWNDWSPETVTLIGPDEMRGKVHTKVTDGELVLRRAKATPETEAEGVKVLAASYSFGSFYADVTGRVRELLKQPDAVFQANPECLQTDPQPGWNKALVIFCEVRGKRAIFSVGEGEDVSRELLLKNARPVADETSAKPDSYPVQANFTDLDSPKKLDRAGVWSNPGDCTMKQEGDKLLLSVPGGSVHDLFGDRRNAPTLLTPVEGDFRVQVKVSGNFDPGTEPAEGFPRTFHGAGLLVMADKENYVRFERAEMIWKDEGRHIYWHPLVQQNLAGSYDEFMGPRNSLEPVFTKPATDLRLERVGDTMSAFLSPDDGAHWEQVARFPTFKAKQVQVGVSASNTSAQEFKPVFEGLHVTLLHDREKW